MLIPRDEIHAKYMLGDPQVGYQKGRKIDENIDLVTEIVRYINNDAPRWTADYYSC